LTDKQGSEALKAGDFATAVSHFEAAVKPEVL